ncbi:protein indeterminate-domain 12-like [Nicotiana tomentosiformis]|uniref:protein indeterminate-domain 12-like n=1 Tax=Nicotiana tomentosiformis TaxID=4098 RepID=UPI00051BC1B3|nr:zinc finger protein GAI-ASSOCIATED FACTOR 1-like [Nicotiana tomentosiformis]
MNQEKQIYHQSNSGCFSLLESSSVLSHQAAMFSDEASVSSTTRVPNLCPMPQTISNHQPQKIKKKRSLPGNPDPDAEVIVLSPKTLLATNRFVCEICSKGFQRDQNLQLHRRGHNLPWKLKQRNNKENRKKAYVCPEPTCVHHHPSRALGDLTGIKKHYCRKHGEKKWKCDKCSKIYAVQSDWKAHSKTCGTREYRCDCGTVFSRKDSFVTHRAFCDALAEESARLSANSALMHRAAVASTTIPYSAAATTESNFHLNQSSPILFPFPTTNQRHFANPPPPPTTAVTTHISLNNPWDPQIPLNPNPTHHEENHNQMTHHPVPIKTESIHIPISSSVPPFYQDHFFHKGSFANIPSPQLSATALLQKAATIGTTHSAVSHVNSTMAQLNRTSLGHMTHKISPEDFLGFGSDNMSNTWQQKSENLTRDFLGLTGDHDHDESCADGNGRNGGLFVTYGGGGVGNGNGGMDFQQTLYERDHSSVLKHHQLGFGFAATATAETASETWGNC